MKLVCLHLDDSVVVPRSKSMGDGLPLVDTRDSSFHMDDGWDIREVLPGTFVITNDHMAESVTIGGYGYSYVSAPYIEELPTSPSLESGTGKRRRK